MKKLLLTGLVVSTMFNTLAANADIKLEEIRVPKSAFNQLGVNYEPENKFEVIKKDGVQKNTARLIQDKSDFSQYTYADLSLKKLADEMSQELAMERADVTEDVKTLWIGAATRSETISYAMYKLSNPDSDKPNESVVKKIIRPVANLTSVAGIGVPDPVLATSAMISGNLLNAMSRSDKEVNYKYSKVTDADMVVLVRKIDDMQRELTDKYCDYMSARRVLKMAIDITAKRKDRADRMINRKREEILIADAYYRDALNYENKKRAEFLAKRSALEQISGNEALREFESILAKRGD